MELYATRNVLQELTGIERRSLAMERLPVVGMLLLGRKTLHRVPLYRVPAELNPRTRR